MPGIAKISTFRAGNASFKVKPKLTGGKRKKKRKTAPKRSKK